MYLIVLKQFAGDFILKQIIKVQTQYRPINLYPYY